MNSENSQGNEPTAVPSMTLGSTSPWGPWRLKLAGQISLIGAVLEAGVWTFFAPDRTYQVFMSLPVLSALALALVLWWLLSGGRNRPALTRRGAVLLALGISYRSTIRFDGFEGDMIPQFSWRWTPTAAQKLEEFLAANPVASKKAADAPTKESVPESNDSTTERPSEKPVEKPHEAPRLDVVDTDWPGFRGLQRDGVVTDPAATFDWSKPPQELWRHPVGAGWSSFSVVGNWAFTQEQRGESEAIVGYEVETGKQVWVHSEAVKFDEPMGGPGPRATPTIHDSKLYALGATGILNCLDPLTGKPLWRRDILADAKAKNIDWAMAGSPLIVDDMVIVNPGGANGSGVVAYHRLTGERIWSGGNDQASYAAPKIATLLGTRQVIVFDGIGLAGHSTENGQQLWKIDWSNNPKVNAAEPVLIDDQTLLIGSGYDMGGALIKLARNGETWTANKAWTAKEFRLKFNAPVVRGGFAYGLDERIMVCLDLKDGKTKWRNGRYGYGQMVLVGDHILVQTERGEVAVVRAAPEKFEEVTKFAALTDKTWNHPVVCRDLLLVRNGAEAVCFRLARKL